MDSRAAKLTLPVHDHPLGQKPVVLLVLLERLGDGGGDGAANLHVGLVEVTAEGGEVFLAEHDILDRGTCLASRIPRIDIWKSENPTLSKQF